MNRGPLGESRYDHPHDDPIAWAKAETLAFTKRKLKRYGLFTLANVTSIGLIVKGMPAHSFAGVIGIPLAISFACFFVPTLYYGAILAGEWLDKKRYRDK